MPGGRRVGSGAAAPAGPARGERLRDVLCRLFPASPPVSPRSSGRRTLGVAVQLASVVVGAAVLLERIPGLHPWDTLYGEDYWMFLVQAIQQPWHLFIPYNGYEEFLPRIISQFALYLPLAQASRLFAVTGAVIAAACGLFVYHATAGHVRSVALRALLGAAVVLLPIAPMEIADSSVNTPWYLLIAVFWALLWRPRTRVGVLAAGLITFFAAASNILVFLLGPLVVLRLFTLRRPRDHVVSASWLVGSLIQVPEVLSRHTSGQDRLTEKSGTLHQALAFYAHDVVLPSLGWHLAWRLQDLAGKDGATAIVAVILAVVIGAILVTQPRNRPFVVTALLTGFVLILFSITVNGALGVKTVLPDLEPGARYTGLPIFLIECTAVIGVDYLLQRRGFSVRQHAADRLPRLGRRPVAGPGAAIAVAVLVVVLGASWVADFRYSGYRSNAVWDWAPIATRWQHGCEQSKTGVVNEWVPESFKELPCANMHF
ncbi:MAG TPA: hypothetical protein VF060_33740 [Trebonia sp.]